MCIDPNQKSVRGALSSAEGLVSKRWGFSSSLISLAGKSGPRALCASWFQLRSRSSGS